MASKRTEEILIIRNLADFEKKINRDYRPYDINMMVMPGTLEDKHKDVDEAPHFQYHLSGILAVKMDDGTVFECRAGDVSLLPTGHDAWVVGDEPAVVIDFQGMIDYASKGH